MKALLLAGGKGTRLKPVTDTMAKQLIPVANRPVIFYALDQIVQAGIRDIGIVVSPETGVHIEKEVGDGSKWSARISYILQYTAGGIAHAIKASRGFLNDSPFLMFLGDNLIQGELGQFVDEFNTYKPSALVLLKEVTNPSAFGVAELDSCGKVRRVVEKPEQPRSNMALVGIYIFASDIHQAINQIEPSRRGELEITDAIQKLLTMKREVRSNLLTGWWLDTGTKESILEANRNILHDCIRRGIRGRVDTESRITGQVEIRAGTEVHNSHIEGPVAIAEDCRVSNSSIGPATSIGTGTIIDKSCVNNSVILAGCRISMVDQLYDSIVGRESIIFKQGEDCCNVSLFVGDNSVVQL